MTARPLLKTLLRPLVRLLFRLRISAKPGAFDTPSGTPLLVIANHESFLDGILLGLFLPIDPVFVVHTGVAENFWFRLILSLVDYLAVDPTSPMAMKKVIRILQSGRPVMIFPEGRLTNTGSLMKVYDGPAFVAAKTGARIVPVRLDGPARSYFSRLSGRYPRRLLPKVTLTVLPAESITMQTSGSAKDKRRKAGDDMRKLMQRMIFMSQPLQTLYSGLLDAMSIYGPGCRLVEDMTQKEHSYGELLRMTLGLAHIAAPITEPGERVGVLLPNVASTICLIFGLTAIRRVPAMLNYTAGVDGMQSACTAAKIRRIVTSRRFVELAKLESTLAGLQGIEVSYLEDLRARVSLADKLVIAARSLAPRLIGRDVKPEDPAVVLFTSGSEGKPKGVILSHRAILSNIAQIRAVIDFSVEDKVLNALPVFHSFGLTAGALLPVLTGTRLMLYPSPLHYRVIPEVVYDRVCTVLFGTSTFLGNYARFAHPYDFFGLRYVVAGAEKLSDDVRTIWYEKFGVRILEGYGATETAPVLAVNTPMAYRSGTVGQLLPGIEARLVTVPGIERGGMLHVRGPNVMSGYYRFENPGAVDPPKSSEGPGWYETGDIVEIDSDGFVRILGRVKRFAKVAGEMVSLEIVEKIAVAASPGAIHAATNMPDAQRGEAIVLITTDRDLTRERLQEAARKLGQPEIAVPRRILAVDTLPVLGTGKTDYVNVKALAVREAA